MDKETAHGIALFRYSVISDAVTQSYDESMSLNRLFQVLSERSFTDYRGVRVSVAAPTIKRWYNLYRRGGFDALTPKARSDCGRQRKIDGDIREQILALRKAYPRLPSTLIRQRLIDNGTILSEDVSLSTITRFVNSVKEAQGSVAATDMRRYEREHINEVWCGDTCHTVTLPDGDKKCKTYVIALIDDASRYIVGIDVFRNDNFVNLMQVMRSAVKRHGVPKLLNFDNGSSFRNKQMQLLAARVGTSLHYNEPYTPTQKAKIERWFRTMRDQWLSLVDTREIKGIDQLRESLLSYVTRYNQTPHSSLSGRTPQERFFDESRIIRRLTDEQIDTAFLLEYERRVSADSVVEIDGVEYEVDYHYSKQRITLRYSPDLSQIYVVDKKTGTLKPIRLLNKQENSRVKRERVRLSDTGEAIAGDAAHTTEGMGND